MAYMSQERKKEIAKEVKAVAKKYGFGGRDITVGVRHHSSLVVNIFRGPLDLIGDANEHNRQYAERTGRPFYEVKGNYQAYWVTAAEKAVDPTVADFFNDLAKAITSTGYYNNSDAMTDYFDHDFYVDINVGRWDRDYEVTA